MNKGVKETITVRFVSTSFVALALIIFKPFGLEAWQLQTYAHLFLIWIMGLVVCLFTDVILKYIVKKPRSYAYGSDYIIRRNLWFQLINTPLISLCICMYRHFLMNNGIGDNRLSWANFLETFVIIAFCSFSIGLYWRFKFRSRYLALELRETRLLNEKLKAWASHDAKQESTEDLSTSHAASPSPHAAITLTGSTNDTVTLPVTSLMYIETIGNYVKVNQLCDGKVRTDMLRATSKQMEEELKPYPMIVRCHRAFLVNLQQVEQIVSQPGSMQLLMKHSRNCIPVSRSNMAGVKAAIKGGNL